MGRSSSAHNRAVTAGKDSDRTPHRLPKHVVTEARFSGNGNERSTETGRQRQLRALLVSLEIGVRLDFHRFHADAGLGVRRAKGARSKDVKLK